MLERLHTFIRDTARRERSGFVRAETITEAINSASSDLWKANIEKVRKGGDDILLQPFKGSTTITSGGSYSLASAATYEITSIDSALNTGLEIVLAQRDADFPKIRAASELRHLLKSDHPISMNAAASGLADLPDDLFKVGQVFYHTFNGVQYEGQILEDREFIDRKNSVIVISDTSNPIARIKDDKIEIYPAPTGGDVYTFTLPYIKFNPVARYEVNGTALDFSFTPSSFALDAVVYWIKPPTLASATYGTPVAGIQPLSGITEMGWQEAAFAEIAMRALTYIGIATNNQLLVQAEQLMKQTNLSDASN